MPAKKSRTLAPLAPVSPAAPESEKRFELNDAETTSIAKRLIALQNEANDLDERLKKTKSLIADCEAILLEKYAAEGLQSLNVDGRTVYRYSSLVASKGKGVATESVVEAMREVGWGHLVGESYAAQTLAATVREARQRAVDAGILGPAWFDPATGQFEPRAENQLAPQIVGGDLIAVVDGIPVEVHSLLYIEEKHRIGMRKS